jgi:hypothetical protein
MKIFTFFLGFLLISSIVFAQNKNYYVDINGNDANDGSQSAPWKTVAPANKFDFEPGDKLLFTGGQTFGKLDLGTNDHGLTISSFNGVATLGGLWAYNVGNITIENLNFRGAGVTGNNESGIQFYIDSSITTDLDNILIQNVSVTNFGSCGILIGAWATENGYNNVQLLNTELYNNGRDGLSTYGYFDRYNHTKLYLYKVKAYRNYGRLDITTTNTGSGIIIGGFDGGLVEYCEAYENGKNNRNTAGGPQGIWCYNTKNTTIQYSVSHSNRAGLKYDGGGFDIDGGSQNCIIQYCYSYNNDGPGFAMFDHGSTNQFTNNIIRYNISQNDARRNYHGALTFWAALSTNKIKNSQLYNNTVYVTPSAVGGYPVAIYFKGSYITNLNFYNNIFHTIGDVKIVKGTSIGNTFSNNNYYTPDSIVNFTNGGVSVDPLFTNAGGGKEGYTLKAASPMINAGKASPTTRDFAGTAVPYNGGYDIGAYEYTASVTPTAKAGEDKSVTLPISSVTLEGSGTDPDGQIIAYSWTKTSGPSQFSINSPNAATTTVSNLVDGTYTFRLTVTDNDGAKAWDDVQVVVGVAPPPPGSRFVKVNLFGGTNPYGNTEWNNWNVTASLTSVALKYSDATVSTIKAGLTKNAISDNGAGYSGGMAPAEVLRYASNANVARTLTLSGLSPSKLYNLELFASRANTGNSTRFTVDGTVMTVVTDNNFTRNVLFTNLAPTPSGQITVSIQGVNTYNYLNGFILTEQAGVSGVPVVNAGNDQSITLPTNSVSLAGTATDPDGIKSYTWTKVSGPAQGTIASPGSSSTNVTGLIQGSYMFRLTVTDNTGATGFDYVVVEVNPAPVPAGSRFVKVNLFGGTNPYSNAEWNNWNVSSSLISNALKYNDASLSGVSAALTSNSGVADNGTAYGSGMAPAEVLRYVATSTTARTLTLSGLAANKTYALELYGSRNANSGYTTVFTIGTASVSVGTYQNLTNKASFTNLAANASGQIVVNIKSANPYNYLNGFILTELSSENTSSLTKSSTRVGEMVISDEQSVTVFPNPAVGYFSLQIKSGSTSVATLKVADAAGRVIEVRRGIAPNTTIQIGTGYAPGVYYAHILQNGKATTLKLLKQPK